MRRAVVKGKANIADEEDEPLFNGHDPAEVEERLVEIFSNCPVDLSDLMTPLAPPTPEEIAWEEECANWEELAEKLGRPLTLADLGMDENGKKLPPHRCRPRQLRRRGR